MKVQRISLPNSKFCEGDEGLLQETLEGATPVPSHPPNGKPTSKTLVQFGKVQFRKVDQVDLTLGSKSDLAAVVPIPFCTFLVKFLIGK